MDFNAPPQTETGILDYVQNHPSDQEPTLPVVTLDGAPNNEPTSPACSGVGDDDDDDDNDDADGNDDGCGDNDDDSDDDSGGDDDDDDDGGGGDDDDDDDNDDDDSDDDYNDDAGYGRGFSENYNVYPLSHIKKTHLEAGNKIILPLSALDHLMEIGVDFPMLFKLENPINGRMSHCGVLEFTGEEGIAFMPDWMIKNMSLEERSLVKIESISLDTATYIKLQPHSIDFLDIRSPKDVLEASFCLGYSCLTVGDTIVIMHEDKKFYVDIVDAKPSSAVCIIETDCEVDFAPPLDYKEPEKKPAKDLSSGNENAEKENELPKFVPFTGRARRLNEESRDLTAGDDDQIAVGVDVDVVDLESDKPCKEMNRLVFGGSLSSQSTSLTKPLDGESVLKSNGQSLKPFTGKKYRLIDELWYGT